MNEKPPGPVLIVGATSPIAQAFATLCAKAGSSLILAGRDTEELAQIAANLRIRHAASLEVVFYDASEPKAGRVLADVATARGVRSVVTFQGVMVGREGFEAMMQTNCVAIAELFEAVIDDALADGRQPVLAAVSSVAGDRGRQSNYPYGATKAALDAYLSGLRNLHSSAGVRVITIKPGFVRTPLSAGKVDPRSPLLAEPDRVARDIFRAVEVRGDVIYSPWFWRPIMAIIRAFPESVFKRLRL